jgi:hypothetical protein
MIRHAAVFVVVEKWSDSCRWPTQDLTYGIWRGSQACLSFSLYSTGLGVIGLEE